MHTICPYGLSLTKYALDNLCFNQSHLPFFILKVRLLSAGRNRRLLPGVLGGDHHSGAGSVLRGVCCHLGDEHHRYQGGSKAEQQTGIDGVVGYAKDIPETGAAATTDQHHTTSSQQERVHQ